MGNIPSSPEPEPKPESVPIQQKRKDYKTFKTWNKNKIKKFIDEFVIL